MCGIAGVYLKNPDFVRKHEGLEYFVNALFLGIESRGKRATGIVAVQPGGHGTQIEKADICASDFIEARDPLPEHTRIVLCHTRYDTKGDPKNNDNNHPVVVGTTFAIHNGSVSNDDEVFKAYQLDRKAEVDSEAIAALVEKYGLDKAAFSLEKLKGSIATALIDPIKFPDTLVLARAANTPIEVVENADFIVWASTRKAIEDAWGLVLGTPPKWNKFHTFKEGEIWKVEDGKVTKDNFTVNRTYSTNYGNRTTHSKSKESSKSNCDDGGTTDCGVDVFGSDSEWPWHERSAPALHHHDERQGREGGYNFAVSVDSQEWTKRDFKKEVEALRAAGRGVARIMDKTDIADIQGMPRWQRCTGCTELVLYDDVRPTYAWGKMCEDCYSVAIKHSQTLYENPAADLSEKERLLLNNWSKIESMIHRKTLSKIAEKVELDPDIIEWLIFRVPKTYTEGSKKMSDLAANLDDLYQEINAKLFKDHGFDDVTNPTETMGRMAPREKKHPLALPVGSRPTTSCPHGTHSNNGSMCHVCRRSSIGLFTAGPPSSVKAHGKTILVCRMCDPKRKQPGKYRLGLFVFCNRHWNECNNPECGQLEKTRRERSGNVGTTPSGVRLCHRCIRSQEGSLFDGSFKDRGITVEQL